MIVELYIYIHIHTIYNSMTDYFFLKKTGGSLKKTGTPWAPKKKQSFSWRQLISIFSMLNVVYMWMIIEISLGYL